MTSARSEIATPSLQNTKIPDSIIKSKKFSVPDGMAEVKGARIRTQVTRMLAHTDKTENQVEERYESLKENEIEDLIDDAAT